MLNLNCVICAELFNSSDDVRVTTCGHMFHFACLRQWMNRSKSCPQCRNKCTDRNIFRIYFNVANPDASHIDVGSLQKQLDDAKLQIKVKEKDLKKAMQNIKRLKKVQKKCTNTNSSLEQKLKKSDSLILTYSEQMKLLEKGANVAITLYNDIKLQRIKQLETESSVVDNLKRELRNCESKNDYLSKIFQGARDKLREEADMRTTCEERISQLESENYQLRQKLRALEEKQQTTNAHSIKMFIIFVIVIACSTLYLYAV